MRRSLRLVCSQRTVRRDDGGCKPRKRPPRLPGRGNTGARALCRSGHVVCRGMQSNASELSARILTILNACLLSDCIFDELQLERYQAHNLKVVGSNPIPATKSLHHIKRFSAALRGGVCVCSTRGSTVEARGAEVFRRRDADQLLPLVRWSDRGWLTLRADKASGVQVSPGRSAPAPHRAPVPSRSPPVSQPLTANDGMSWPAPTRLPSHAAASSGLGGRPRGRDGSPGARRRGSPGRRGSPRRGGGSTGGARGRARCC